MPRNWPGFRKAYFGIQGIIQHREKNREISMGHKGMDVEAQYTTHVPIWRPKNVPGALGTTTLDNDASPRCPNHNRFTKWVITECRTHNPIHGGLGWNVGVTGRAHPGRHGEITESSSQETNTRPPEWGSFAAITEMAEAANTPMKWCVVAAVVLSTIMGLRISEAATLKLRHINGLARRVTFWD